MFSAKMDMFSPFTVSLPAIITTLQAFFIIGLHFFSPLQQCIGIFVSYPTYLFCFFSQLVQSLLIRIVSFLIILFPFPLRSKKPIPNTFSLTANPCSKFFAFLTNPLYDFFLAIESYL